jgi:hypothetical protein
MNVKELCRKVPDLKKYLDGLTVENVLMYIGKESDTRKNQKEMEEGRDFVKHDCAYGGKISDQLSRVNDALRKYKTAFGERRAESKEQAESVQQAFISLSLELAKVKVSMRVAQCVQLTQSLDLPDVPWEDVNLGNGIYKTILACRDDVKWSRLKQWGDAIYAKAYISGGGSGAASELLKEIGGVSESDDKAIEEAVANAPQEARA